jgi:hypothetical protein
LKPRASRVTNQVPFSLSLSLSLKRQYGAMEQIERIQARREERRRVQAESKARKEEARLFHGDDLHNLEYMAMIERERALLLLNQPPPVNTPGDARVRPPWREGGERESHGERQ